MGAASINARRGAAFKPVNGFPPWWSSEDLGSGDTFSFPKLALEEEKLVKKAAWVFLSWAAGIGANEVLNTEIGGFFNGESVGNASGSGGGIDILSKVF